MIGVMSLIMYQIMNLQNNKFYIIDSQKDYNIKIIN